MTKEFRTSYGLLSADLFRSVAARDLAGHGPLPLVDEINGGRLSIPSVFACNTFARVRLVKASGAAHVMKPISLAAVEAELSFVMTEAFDRECPTQPSIER